ncbi:hypothetical protein K7X08_008167 [Anisodus acutangulus]|uniref:Peptidase S8/S53 domain-containing protein n=1 Tax=Anisodus acutangulus TaxID=402998 RepID=A0A9Q1MTY2_9SOLA|nr:hypothetical protein K7X08_008167 [Anisodus acutangulus]
MPKMFASHHHWHSSTIDSTKIATPALFNSHHPAPKLLYSYDNVFHGFSAVLSKDEIEALKKSTGFISAYKDTSLEAHTTHTSEILKLNPSSDTIGHGTHVASIALGNFVKGASYFGYAPGTAKGVAPRARLAVYKFSFDEGNFTSDLIAAMDQAVADSIDMICISYGWRFIPLYEDTIAIAAFGAMRKGVLVSASEGNSGLHMGSLNNGVPWIFTEASGHTDRWFSGTLTLGSGPSTSIDAPHIAGIAAMVKGAHREWSPSAIRSAMMTTSNPLDNTQKPIRNSEDNKRATPLDMGAGHVDPNRALIPASYMMPLRKIMLIFSVL